MRSSNVQDARIPTRLKLSALWTAMMLLYVYADLLSFYKPGQLEEMQGGMMGPLQVSQATLLLASVLMALPALMVFLSLALAPQWSRMLNLALGALYTLVNVGNIVGETWAYYLAFGVLEIGITVTILAYAWRWPTSPGANEMPTATH